MFWVYVTFFFSTIAFWSTEKKNERSKVKVQNFFLPLRTISEYQRSDLMIFNEIHIQLSFCLKEKKDRDLLL